MKLKNILIILFTFILLINFTYAINLPSNKISHEELKEFSDNDVENFLENNLVFTNKVTDFDSGKVYYYYKTKTIELNKDGTFIVKDLDLQISYPLKDLEYCLEKNSEEECENILVEGNDYNIDDMKRDSIKLQKEKQIKKHIDRIIDYKNPKSSFLEDLFEQGNQIVRKIREYEETITEPVNTIIDVPIIFPEINISETNITELNQTIINQTNITINQTSLDYFQLFLQTLSNQTCEYGIKYIDMTGHITCVNQTQPTQELPTSTMYELIQGEDLIIPSNDGEDIIFVLG
jgi:hypothetical protein